MKLKLILMHLAVIAFLAHAANAQCPPPGDVQFSSQGEVNQFLIDYPNCNQIQGRLIIQGADVTDLSPLTNLTTVNDLIIQNTGLVNLSGLENITTIDETLRISDNSFITTFEALNQVSQVGNLDLNSNPAVVNLVGLNGLTEVTSGRVQINWNNSLQSIAGLENLTSIYGHFELKVNPLLTDVSGLSNLSSVGGLTLMLNNSLQNVEGLSELTELTGQAGLIITMNSALSSLEGFLGLTSLGNKSLQVKNNASLTSLYGLDNIDAASISNLYIQSSQQLSTCNVPSICDYLSGGGTATISGNSVGCTSVQQVLEFCEGFENCPTGDLTLSTQAEVDLFLLQYPDCTIIQGNLFIGSETTTTDIVNLNSLQNIINVVGSVTIQNTSLENMTGLNALVQIGGDLEVSDNSLLESLSELSNLNTISGSELAIINNDELSSLIGLGNIDPNSISHLILESSQNLTTCDIESICMYISTFGSTYSILGNATGCNSFNEVLVACQDTLPNCPPADIQFFSQAELEHFAIQYPDCIILNGNVNIGTTSVTDISSLQPLNNLTLINGSITIDRTSLINLNGLENLNQTGHFQLLQNDQLESVDGLDNLTTLLGSFIVQSNPLLVNFEGLNSLLTASDLNIVDNESLSSLEGLNNLMETTGSATSISQNPSLIDLSGLESLQHISGILRIDLNENLVSLDGLESLQSITEHLEIKSNPSLVSIGSLTNLTEVPVLLQITSNPELVSLEGLNNLSSVGSYLLISDNQSLINLQELNSLEIIGDRLVISNNNNLESLEGLENLMEIGSYLEISSNEVLTNIQALSNITHLNDLLNIDNNPNLESLQGLNNLVSIGFDFPGQLLIMNNQSLNSLEPLLNLETLMGVVGGGSIHILNNESLISLSGLDNIDPNTIAYIRLESSLNLSTCNVESICTFLSNGGDADISGNATGCQTEQQILDLCVLGTNTFNLDSSISVHPNPLKDWLFIETSNGVEIINISIFDVSGKLIKEEAHNADSINVANLAQGLYFINIKTNQGQYIQKLVK